MGTYQIPRNTKGESRWFYIFSTRALIYTVGGAIIGLFFHLICLMLKSAFPKAGGVFSAIGIIIIIFFALIGFLLGTVKVPNNDRFEITKKAAGVRLDKVVWESIKFKFKKCKIYIYDTEELTRDQIKRELAEEKEKEEKLEQERMEKEKEKSNSRRRFIQ